MLPKNVLYYGREENLPEQTLLRAGPMSLMYENGDLRYIRLGEVEILRRIYVAVRDRNWGTVAPAFSDFEMHIEPASFRITYQVQNMQNEIDFAWKGTIHGEADGTIRFSMDGTARSTFWRNRIGFCVLYPASMAGRQAFVDHVDGTREQAVFPVDIIPSQPVHPFADLRGIVQDIYPGVSVSVSLDGDIFEMEDQRNWTDASYKIFSTPLRLPYPVEIQQGTKIHQEVTIRLQGNSAHHVEVMDRSLKVGEAISINATFDGPASSVPGIGLGMATHGQELSEQELARIRALNLHHLRVDLTLTGPAWDDRLTLAARESRLLGVPLAVALIGPESTGEMVLKRLRRRMEELRLAVCAWLCYPAKEIFQGGSATTGAVQAARSALHSYDPTIPFCAGTNTDLIFMKRTPPPLDLIDQVTFSICPQVHAFDNASLVETLEVQAAAVESARRLGKGHPVMVSPVTLKMRDNPYASAPSTALKQGELPPSVDERQMSLFGAVWTLGSLKYLSESGASAVTYYETTGWRGVMETTAGSPAPERFRSLPGRVFPLYHVLAFVNDFAGGKVHPLHSPQPLKVSGMLLKKKSRQRLLIANLTLALQTVEIQGTSGRFACRMLDETTVLEALARPEEFQAQAGIELPRKSGCLSVTLLPYATACLDQLADEPSESLA